MSNIDPAHYPDMGLVGSHGQAILMQEFSQVAYLMQEPSYLLAAHLKISIDGNQWCVLFGENLQDGVAGFGDSPAEAMSAFDKAWKTKLRTDAHNTGKGGE